MFLTDNEVANKHTKLGDEINTQSSCMRFLQILILFRHNPREVTKSKDINIKQRR